MSMQMREIRAAAAAAWKAYAATGMTGDDVQPLQGGAEDTLHVRATLFDSLGTLYVMGLYEEYEQAVAQVLRVGAPRTFIYPTSSFEYNIRVVGGTLSAAQLSGDARLLAVAEDAAHTLLSSSYFLWPSPLPMARVRMQPLTVLNFPVWLLARIMDAAWYLYERVVFGPKSSKIARMGSYSLELRALTLATGNWRYACAADAIQSHILADVERGDWPVGPEFHKDSIGLHLHWDTLTGQGLPWSNATLDRLLPSLGTGSDSFWEYLLKSHLMMPSEAPHLYGAVYRKLARQLAHEASSHDFMQFIFRHRNNIFVSHLAGQRLHEHLGCYIPGMLMLGAHTLEDRAGSGDMDTGLQLLDGCIWTCVHRLLLAATTTCHHVTAACHRSMVPALFSCVFLCVVLTAGTRISL
jgi:mannosyl-oligosaccharide alpha-1,2-mannosidase